MPKNINCITIVIAMGALRKWKLKKITKQTEEFFFSPMLLEITRNTVMAPRFWLAASIIWLYESHFSLVYFQRAKIHFSLPISPFWCAQYVTVPDKVTVMILVLSTWGVESERHWRSSVCILLYKWCWNWIKIQYHFVMLLQWSMHLIMYLQSWA